MSAIILSLSSPCVRACVRERREEAALRALRVVESEVYYVGSHEEKTRVAGRIGSDLMAK